MIRVMGLVLFLLPVLAGSLALHYVLPRYTVVQITGVDSKRAERLNSRLPEGTPDARDQYLLFLKQDDRSDMGFRNEDTGWGFPPYFKFDSAEIQAQSTDLVGKPVLIKFYGWRSKIFRLFPNVLSIAPAPEHPSLTSYTRVFFFSLWVLAVVWVFPRWLGLFRRRPRQDAEQPTP